MQQRVGFESGAMEPKQKVKYTAKQRIVKEMDDSQRAGAERWNEMVDVLQKNGLMEERKGG